MSAGNKAITLYAAHDTPFPHRIRIALEEAGADYTTIWIDLIDKQDWYEKKVYPAARVPYLVYGGKKLLSDEAPSADAVGIPESSVILEFIADTFPSAMLLPADPILRAKARLFCRDVDAELLPAFFGFFFLEKPIDTLLDTIDGMQQRLPAEGFAVGPWSIADAAFMSVILRIDTMLKLEPFTIKGAGKTAMEALQGPRFARMQKYKADNMARPSVAMTWDEKAVSAMVVRRMDRFKRTGMVNVDVTLPIPKLE